MTLDLRELYREAILDHNRHPRNFRKLEGADRTAEGYNPLCGDKITAYLRIENDRVSDIGFEGSGCAISMASASMMTESVKGKSLADVQALFERFHQLVTQAPSAPPDAGTVGKLAAFAGVREFPLRVKCATLPWHTLRAAIENRPESVTTESGPASQPALPPSASPATDDLRRHVIEALRTVYDPEIPVNLYDLGLIYDIVVAPSGAVTIRMTFTAPACPIADVLLRQVDKTVRAVPGVTAVTVELVWDPPWNRSIMSEPARLQLGLI
ncbi:MAG: SUF system NifU family Fe-S cluster assembly protein [Nitrospirae bacterium]|nr:SUF system NifU family Fe-S cluster assembly protein [Nitrospirota bacterium]